MGHYYRFCPVWLMLVGIVLEWSDWWRPLFLLLITELDVYCLRIVMRRVSASIENARVVIVDNRRISALARKALQVFYCASFRHSETRANMDRHWHYCITTSRKFHLKKADSYLLPWLASLSSVSQPFIRSTPCKRFVQVTTNGHRARKILPKQVYHCHAL